MSEALTIFLYVYISLNVLGTILFTAVYITGFCIGELVSHAGLYFLLPVGMRAWSKMNWFGCVVASVCALAIAPVCWLIQFVHYIFHVGREK